MKLFWHLVLIFLLVEFNPRKMFCYLMSLIPAWSIFFFFFCHKLLCASTYMAFDLLLLFLIFRVLLFFPCHFFLLIYLSCCKWKLEPPFVANLLFWIYFLPVCASWTGGISRISDRRGWLYWFTCCITTSEGLISCNYCGTLFSHYLRSFHYEPNEPFASCHRFFPRKSFKNFFPDRIIFHGETWVLSRFSTSYFLNVGGSSLSMLTWEMRNLYPYYGFLLIIIIIFVQKSKQLC